MSKLSAYVHKVEEAENDFRACLKELLMMEPKQINLLMVEIKSGAFEHLTPEEIWKKATGEEADINEIPAVQISHLCGMWRKLKHEEEFALEAWKQSL